MLPLRRQACSKEPALRLERKCREQGVTDEPATVTPSVARMRTARKCVTDGVVRVTLRVFKETCSATQAHVLRSMRHK